MMMFGPKRNKKGEEKEIKRYTICTQELGNEGKEERKRIF
jgi:hypothetical protein